MKEIQLEIFLTNLAKIKIEKKMVTLLHFFFAYVLSASDHHAKRTHVLWQRLRYCLARHDFRIRRIFARVRKDFVFPLESVVEGLCGVGSSVVGFFCGTRVHVAGV